MRKVENALSKQGHDCKKPEMPGTANKTDITRARPLFNLIKILLTKLHLLLTEYFL